MTITASAAGDDLTMGEVARYVKENGSVRIGDTTVTYVGTFNYDGEDLDPALPAPLENQ